MSILPLSLEDNSTIAGTATILDDWANIFSLSFSSDKTTFIPSDVVRGNFDIQLARSRVEYLNSKFRHQNYMADHEAQLRSKEKTLYGQTLSELQLDENDDSEKGDTDVEDACVEKGNPATTLDNEKQRFKREDEKFWSLYNELASHLRKSLQSDRDEE